MIKRALIILVIIGVFVVIVLAVTNQTGLSSQSTSPWVYTSQAECESATGWKCSFVMCDYVPEGKTFEEVCGGVGKQWSPISSSKLDYEVIEWGDALGSSLKPYCAITYFDTVSLHIGQAMSADEAVEVWSATVEKLEPLYWYKVLEYRKDGEAENLRLFLYDNFLWNSTPDSMKIKYRKKEHGYEHEGWYFATIKGELLGEYFLSNDGYLMPVMKTCSRVECCL